MVEKKIEIVDEQESVDKSVKKKDVSVEDEEFDDEDELGENDIDEIEED